jgi:site-specific recombinase XerD
MVITLLITIATENLKVASSKIVLSPEKKRNDPKPEFDTPQFPGVGEIAALRAWYSGLSARVAAQRYLPKQLEGGTSARTVISSVRRQLITCARAAHQADIVKLLEHAENERVAKSKDVLRAIEVLRNAPRPVPMLADSPETWLTPRAASALLKAGINTLAELALRAARRRRWWVAIPGFGETNAKSVDAFFAAYPALSRPAVELVNTRSRSEIVPWETLAVPEALDGSQGLYRAPTRQCLLGATNDLAAVEAWLQLHESAATRRAYRKEAERLILWAIVERNKAFSSLNTEDAIAYRAFLRAPTPAAKWIGPACSRQSPDWRPFSGSLSARSAAYSLTVLATLYRWLISQQYVVANPFAGIKVSGATREQVIDTSRGFSFSEWHALRTEATVIEQTCGWSSEAAHRVRFMLDFGLMTGLRASELVGVRLGDIRTDADGDRWLRVVGKGKKTGKVAVPRLAYEALRGYLLERGLPEYEPRWKPETPIIGPIGEDQLKPITAGRLWAIMRRCFHDIAARVQDVMPALAQKLTHASPHWMRHTHATHVLEKGGDLTTVRDNLRHASISTTSVYLHADDKKRARILDSAFAQADSSHDATLRR